MTVITILSILIALTLFGALIGIGSPGPSRSSRHLDL